MKWKMGTTIGMVALFFSISIACDGITKLKDAEDWCTSKGGDSKNSNNKTVSGPLDASTAP